MINCFIFFDGEVIRIDVTVKGYPIEDCCEEDGFGNRLLRCAVIGGH